MGDVTAKDALDRARARKGGYPYDPQELALQRGIRAWKVLNHKLMSQRQDDRRLEAVAPSPQPG
jgi:hypothetical protein